MPYELCIPLGEISAEISVFCPDDVQRDGVSSWSLRPIQEQKDSQHPVALEVCRILHRRKISVRNAYAPRTSANSALIIGRELLKPIPIGDGKIILHRNSEVPADWVFLLPREAFVTASFGCPIIIAAGDGKMIVAHAGRDSLVDPRVLTGDQRRKHKSIVSAIVEAFSEVGVLAEEISMRMTLSISPTKFEHRFDGEKREFNQALCAYIHARWPSGIIVSENGALVDLERIFIQQAEVLGVFDVQAMHSLDGYPDMAHPNDGKGDSKRRNLTVVKFCVSKNC